MDLMNLFKEQMTGQVLKQMTGQTGADEQQTASAAQNIFSTLMGAVAKNASTEQGAASLNKALEKDHDGSLLDNLGSLFGSTSNTNTNATNGAGILGHMLGGKQQGVVQSLSAMNNMSPEATQGMMTTIAPMVMAMLGKAKQNPAVNTNNMQEFMNSQKQNLPQNNQLSGIMGMLDQDGDGNVMDDLGNMLGGFFGK